MDLNLSYRDSLMTILFPTLDLSELDAWHQVQLVDNYFKEHFGHPYQFVEGDAFEDDLVHMLTNAYPVDFVQLLKHKDLMKHYSKGFKILLLSIDEGKYQNNFNMISK